MPSISDLVRDSKLETEFHRQYTQHVYYISGQNPRQRKIRKEERWEKEKNLGAGSFGTVWREKLVTESDGIQYRAVKEIRKCPQSSSAIDYNRELEAIAKFSHPKYERCFVASSGWYENSASIYIAMEYFPSGDLQSYLSALIPESEIQQITYQILEGLLFMHDNGFAHRDLKPANILVKCTSPDWWVKIGDFGISKRAEEGLTSLRTFSGTPGFLAPEVLLRSGLVDDDALEINEEYTVAIDLWSLGEIVFRALTGEQAFSNKSLWKYIREKSGFPVSVLRAHGVSSEGCDIVERLMAVIPKDRLTAKEALRHKWIEIETLSKEGVFVEMKRPFSAIEVAIPSSQNPTTQASACWSTLNDATTHLKNFTNLASNENSLGMHHSSVHLTTQKSARRSTSDDAASELKNFTDLEVAEKSSTTYQETHNTTAGSSIIEESEDFGNEAINLKAQNYKDGNHILIEPTRWKLEGHLSTVSSVAFSRDGALLASGSFDHMVRLWDTATRKTQREFKGHADVVTGVAFSPNGVLVASGSWDHTVRLWDTATTNTQLEFKGHADVVTSVAFSPNGALIVSGSSDRTVRLWNIATGRMQHMLKGHEGAVRSVAFSPNGALIVSGSLDHTVRFWDTATGTAQWELKSRGGTVSSVAFSPDGTLVASGSSDHTIRLLNVITGTMQRKLEGHTQALMSVAFSSNGVLVISGSLDQTVRLWNIATGEIQRKFEDHTGSIFSVAFSPDSSLMVSGCGRTVQLWDITTVRTEEAETEEAETEEAETEEAETEEAETEEAATEKLRPQAWRKVLSTAKKKFF